MNKKLLISPVILTLLLVGLSGCNESDGNNGIISGDTDKVEIVDYDIETYNKEGSGFIYNYTKVADGFAFDKIDERGYFWIFGEIGNIAGEILSIVEIEVKFYDKISNYLFSETNEVYNLDKNYKETFEVKVYNDNKYFEDIDNIKFEINVSSI